jgi:hypothetical protein
MNTPEERLLAKRIRKVLASGSPCRREIGLWLLTAWFYRRRVALVFSIVFFGISVYHLMWPELRAFSAREKILGFGGCALVFAIVDTIANHKPVLGMGLQFPIDEDTRPLFTRKWEEQG